MQVGSRRDQEGAGRRREAIEDGVVHRSTLVLEGGGVSGAEYRRGEARGPVGQAGGQAVRRSGGQGRR